MTEIYSYFGCKRKEKKNHVFVSPITINLPFNSLKSFPSIKE